MAAQPHALSGRLLDVGRGMALLRLPPPDSMCVSAVLRLIHAQFLIHSCVPSRLVSCICPALCLGPVCLLLPSCHGHVAHCEWL